MKVKQLTQAQLAEFCESLALLLHAGVAPADGLALLAQQAQGGEQEARLLQEMADQLDNGQTLAAAMEASARFPAYLIGLVTVGEYTGRLEEALQALASYYEKRDEQERRLRSTLTYPVLLLLIMLVVIVVLLTQVLPVFNEVYASLGGSLTGVAGGLLLLGRALDAAMPLLCVLLAAVLVFLALFAMNDHVRRKVLAAWRRHRGDKGAARSENDAHAAQVLAMGLYSGLEADQALEMAARLLQEVPAAAARCRKGCDYLQAGDDLPTALQKAGVLPAAACRLLAIGIRGGSGDRVMGEIATRLAEQANEATEASAARIEPSLVLVTSLLVGAILLSVMLPLMHIMGAIG
jgi:type IV pilus assembly protein PilC